MRSPRRSNEFFLAWLRKASWRRQQYIGSSRKMKTVMRRRREGRRKEETKGRTGFRGWHKTE